MKDKKVSIIVPMYNAEKYIERCIDSLLKQTHKNIEIICINDGSIDFTLEKIKHYNSEKIRVYTKKNEGVSKARNYGLSKATGEFITFVDSDDYIQGNMIEELLKNVEDELSLVICDTHVIEKTYEYKLDTFINSSVSKTKEEVLRAIIEGKCGLVCAKLVSKKVIDRYNITFDSNLKYGEDQLFFLNIAERCASYNYVYNELYVYDRSNETAVTNKYFERLIDNFIYLQKEVIKIFERNNIINLNNMALINQRMFNSIWKCLNNDIDNIKKLGIKKCLCNIEEVLIKASNVIFNDVTLNSSRLEKNLDSAIKSKNKKLYAFKLLILVWLFNLKSKVVNRR